VGPPDQGRIMTALVWFLIVYTGPVGWGGNFGPAKLGPCPTSAVCEEARRAVAAEVGYPAVCRGETRSAQGTAG
jgi:hypothetical protein